MNWEKWKHTVIQQARSLGVEVNPGQADQMAVYTRELLLWNRKINLTAITNPDEIALKHFVDSLAAVPLVKDKSRLLDIGTGGGFPGLVLKIMIPAIEVTLLDASRKKIHFLKQVIRQLKLSGVEAVHNRGECLSDIPEFQHAYDVIVCRAFSSLTAFISMALPMLCPNGTILAYKGSFPEKELSDLSRFFRTQGISAAITKKTYRLPLINAGRSMVRIIF